MVVLEQVSVQFGARRALRDVSFRVARGGSLAFWGPNGAGKSTAFHALLGLVPYTGTIRIDGRDVARHGPAVRRLVGWAPQDLAPPDLTVARTVRFMAELRGAAAPAGMLTPFGLDDALDQPVAALSGGQRKRLSLALALLGDPQVLLLDEPTANLDPAGRSDMLRLLERLRQQGKTLLIASHRLGDVVRLADQVAFMADGVITRVVDAGSLVRRHVARAPTAATSGRSTGREGERPCAVE